MLQLRQITQNTAAGNCDILLVFNNRRSWNCLTSANCPEPYCEGWAGLPLHREVPPGGQEHGIEVVFLVVEDQRTHHQDAEQRLSPHRGVHGRGQADPLDEQSLPEWQMTENIEIDTQKKGNGGNRTE